MIKKQLLIFFTFVVLLGTTSCDKNDNSDISKILTLTVASVREDKGNIEESPSYRYSYYVKYEGSDNWVRFPYAIQTFYYEEGYEYIIKVKEISLKNPPQDAPSVEYHFIELISKEKIDSVIPQS